jgi:hypothetical protein
MPWWGWILAGGGGLSVLFWLLHHAGWLRVIAEGIAEACESVVQLDLFDDDD